MTRLFATKRPDGRYVNAALSQLAAIRDFGRWDAKPTDEMLWAWWDKHYARYGWTVVPVSLTELPAESEERRK